MHGSLGPGECESPGHGLGVADIGLDEGNAGLALQVGEGRKVAGVGEFTATVTAWPPATSKRVRFDPMKPAPLVINIFTINL